MLRTVVCCLPLFLCAAHAAEEAATSAPAAQAEETAKENKADEPAAAATQVAKADGKAEGKNADDAKLISGMSILGNQEAPKSLVIVPWKSSQVGDMTGFSRMLDDSVQPVDKEVFTRELSYYEIRSK
jgi:hypothetical protein